MLICAKDLFQKTDLTFAITFKLFIFFRKNVEQGMLLNLIQICFIH